MFVIDGILDDQWCQTEEGFCEMLRALTPMLTTALMLQVESYLDSPKPKNQACVNAVNRMLGDKIKAYKSIAEVESAGILDQALGVSFRALYYNVKAGSTRNGRSIDTLKSACLSLKGVNVSGISDSVAVKSDTLDTYCYTVARHTTDKEALKYIKGAKSTLMHGEDAPRIRVLKRVVDDVDWILKSLDYMQSVGIGSGSDEEGSVFNFAYT